jgi:7-cyano-7-deazaguanine synthase
MGGARTVSLGILLSGGMDSTALAWWRRPKIAFTVDYGQASAAGEVRAASAVCEAIGAAHEVIRVDCASLGSGDLAGTPPLPIAPIPEWWPYRNQLLVTLVGMRAVSLGIQTLMLGAVQTDSQHLDGTPAFFEALDRLMALQEGGLRIEAPALGMTGAELVRRSNVPRSVLAWAHSCHTGEFACGVCRGCAKHFTVTQELWGEGY